MASRPTKKSGMKIDRNVALVAFCVVAGVAVTACQPQLMKNEEKMLAPSEDTQMSSPAPAGTNETEGEAMMKPKSSANPTEVNAKIDSSLKSFDASMNDGDPKDITGADLN